jgi:hypothetical protein
LPFRIVRGGAQSSRPSFDNKDDDEWEDWDDLDRDDSEHDTTERSTQSKPQLDDDDNEFMKDADEDGAILSSPFLDSFQEEVHRIVAEYRSEVRQTFQQLQREILLERQQWEPTTSDRSPNDFSDAGLSDDDEIDRDEGPDQAGDWSSTDEDSNNLDDEDYQDKDETDPVPEYLDVFRDLDASHVGMGETEDYNNDNFDNLAVDHSLLPKGTSAATDTSNETTEANVEVHLPRTNEKRRKKKKKIKKKATPSTVRPTPSRPIEVVRTVNHVADAVAYRGAGGNNVEITRDDNRPTELRQSVLRIITVTLLMVLTQMAGRILSRVLNKPTETAAPA